MIMEIHDEDYIRELVEENIDYVIEDEGIGNYDYGDGHYTDVSFQMRIVGGTQFVVYYEASPDSVIITEVHGSVTGYGGVDDDEEYECDWIAELLTVEWNQEFRRFEAVYGIGEG